MNTKSIAEGPGILVKNLMTAAVTPPPAGYASRLEYWVRHTGIGEPKCAHEVCDRAATEGAMARLAFSMDKTVYIFPACETCARRTEMLYISGPIIPVP
ncbi:MAG: hypothetical protein K2O24_09605 [Muribaculaceae bacterium]|nr:hypothetical protein [Muribaculaceae bacterium]